MSPRLLRITVGGDALAGFALAEPAASVRLLIPEPGAPLVVPSWNGNEFLLPDGSRPTIRTYTPRRFDADALELDLDVVLHEAGAVPRWATGAEIGTVAAVSGPGRGYAIDPAARSFVLAGDESAVPAISQLLEQLPVDAEVLVLLEAADPGARHELPPHPRATVRWHDAPTGSLPGSALFDAVAAADLSDARVWAAGEAAAMQRIRRVLFDERGITRSAAVVRGYWKTGRRGDADEPVR